MPAWRRLFHLHLSWEDGANWQLLVLETHKPSVCVWGGGGGSRGVREARGALLRSISMIHLHKSAKLVIIALANPAMLQASKYDE